MRHSIFIFSHLASLKNSSVRTDARIFANRQAKKYFDLKGAF